MRKKDRVKLDIGDGLAKVRVAIVSATCGNGTLLAGFKTGFWNVVNGSNKEIVLNVFVQGADPKELLSNHDLIIIDPVVTWGARTTLLPQIRKEVKASSSKCALLLLPRKKEERLLFFKNPQNLAKALICEVMDEEVQVSEGVSEKETLPEDNAILPPLRVLIALKGVFGSQEAQELGLMLEDILPRGSEIFIEKKPKKGLLKSVDVMFTSPSTDKIYIGSSIKNRTTNLKGRERVEVQHSTRRGSFSGSEKMNFQSLSQVSRALEVNPALRVVVVDSELSKFIANYCGIISGFMQFPFAEASVSFCLRKAARELGILQN